MQEKPMSNFQRAILRLITAELRAWNLEEVMDVAGRVRQSLGLPESVIQPAICGPGEVVVLVQGGPLTRAHYLEELAQQEAEVLGQAPSPAPHAAGSTNPDDTGAHYRYEHRVALTAEDVARGYVDVKLDPYRIADIYDLGGGPREHIVKKGLRGTSKGTTERRLVKELRDALDRWEEMLDENSRLEHFAASPGVAA